MSLNVYLIVQSTQWKWFRPHLSFRRQLWKLGKLFGMWYVFFQLFLNILFTLINFQNVMQYVVSVREMPPWRIYHIFQGTSMSLRVCDELKTCRKLIIPENLLWNVIEKIVSGLAYIHHEKKLLYNNFTLDHVYYALDGTQLILENPLLHDFPNLSSQVKSK